MDNFLIRKSLIPLFFFFFCDVNIFKLYDPLKNILGIVIAHMNGGSHHHTGSNSYERKEYVINMLWKYCIITPPSMQYNYNLI